MGLKYPSSEWYESEKVNIDAEIVAGDEYIGLATVDIGKELPAGTQYIGLATVDVGTIPEVNSLATVTQSGAVELAAGDKYIGLTTVDIGSSPTLTVDATSSGDVPITLDSEKLVLTTGTDYIGLATVDIGSSPVLDSVVTIAPRTDYIGLMSVSGGVDVSLDGSTKTVASLAVAAAATGSATLVVPSGSFHVTHVILSAASACRVNIKSGATYLIGNASIGVNLDASGGWVENGSTADPLYDGLASNAALVLEVSNGAPVGGRIRYFDE